MSAREIGEPAASIVPNQKVDPRGGIRPIHPKVLTSQGLRRGTSFCGGVKGLHGFQGTMQMAVC